MMKKQLVLGMFAILLMSMTADKKAYQFFNKEGKAISYEHLFNEVKDADIVMFGELHNNAISHWMEFQLTKDMAKEKGDKLVLGAEMYEADGQLLVDEYLSGLVKYKYFKAQARLWPNDPTDYSPLLKLAKENNIPFIATNVPRRYAAAVNVGGFEALDKFSDEAKKYMAPLPINYDDSLECYSSMQKMMGDHGANIARAQGLKDATMAYFILKNWEKGKTFIHYNGSYHSDNYQGIVWHLLQSNPKLKIITITTAEQEDLEKIDEETAKIADLILVVDENVTKTY
jgi:uncharacterized iron-regulated protein